MLNISSGIKEPVFSSTLSFQYLVNLLNMQGVRVTGDPSYELPFQLMTMPLCSKIWAPTENITAKTTLYTLNFLRANLPV